MSSPCNACQRERTPTSSKKCTHSSRSAPSSRLEMASTGCCFHNRRAIRLSSRRANRQSSRSTRFVVISSVFCMVGPPSGVLPLSEDQPRIKLIPYVGISDPKVTRLWCMAFDVCIPGIVHLLPSHREEWGVLLQDRLGLPNQGLALGRVEFVVNLPHQSVKFLIVPFGVILRPILHIPGIKIISGIE